MKRNNTLFTRLIFSFLILSLGCTNDNLVTGVVTKVKDGDSFVMNCNGRTLEVRLQGIDCPEKGQPFSDVAKKFTSGMILENEIKLEKSGIDKYKRTIGTVYLTDGRCLNEDLVEAGLAWHFKKYSNSQKLAELEESAKEKKIGLWVDADPLPPWKYRSKKRKASHSKQQ